MDDLDRSLTQAIRTGVGATQQGANTQLHYEGEEDDGEAPNIFLPKDLVGTWMDFRTLLKYVGLGWLLSLAYLDPGNLESDLQSGADTGYHLLWVLLAAHIMGCVLQVLAARLATVTGKNLAQLCKANYARKTALTIWVMTEVAIVGSDVQEVLGTAIAFKMLFNWPLWLGTIVTGLDTFTFFLVHYAGPRFLELLIFILISVMMVTFSLNWLEAPPPAAEALSGCVPQAPMYAVEQLVGIVGATIMPHNIYLHSALVQSRAVDRVDENHVRQSNKYFTIDTIVSLALSFTINFFLQTTFAESFFTEACAMNGNLAGFSPLACVPGTSGPPNSDGCHGASCEACTTARGLGGYCAEVGLDTAGNQLAAVLPSGRVAKSTFALGLLAAGQSSTMTGTFAGQHVMQGFLSIKIATWKRTLLTRSVALIPAVAVACLSTAKPQLQNEFNEWLNILQSIQLPFALLPLLHFVADREIMGDPFVLSLGWQVLCCLIALIVIGINFFLLIQNLAGVPVYAVAMASVAIVGYLVFMWVIIRSDLQRFGRYLKRWMQDRGGAQHSAMRATSEVQLQVVPAPDARNRFGSGCRIARFEGSGM